MRDVHDSLTIIEGTRAEDRRSNDSLQFVNYFMPFSNYWDIGLDHYVVVVNKRRGFGPRTN